MAKLYAEVTSDKGGRKATKGGDEIINVTFNVGNLTTHAIKYEAGRLTVFTKDAQGNKMQRVQTIKHS